MNYERVVCNFFDEKTQEWVVDAWRSVDDNGFVIARINPVSKTVRYLSDSAKTDPYAQKVIKNVLAVEYLTEKAIKRTGIPRLQFRTTSGDICTCLSLAEVYETLADCEVDNIDAVMKDLQKVAKEMLCVKKLEKRHYECVSLATGQVADVLRKIN